MRALAPPAVPGVETSHRPAPAPAPAGARPKIALRKVGAESERMPAAPPSGSRGAPASAQGRPPAPAPAPSQPKSRPSSRPKAPPPQRPQAHPPSRDNGDLSDERVRQLYAKYIEAKRANRESTAAITYDSLAKSLRDSSEKLKEKHGGKSVDFEVTVKDGKTILRPVIK